MLEILLGAVAFLTAANGLFDEKVEKFNPENPKRFLRRIRMQGYTFLMLSSVTFGLVVYKEMHTFDSRIRSIYPDFDKIVASRTGHSLDVWEKYMSYRVSLRFELQDLYEKVFPGRKKPVSMKTTLRELGERGAVDSDLCKDLDYIRLNTYYVEWGTQGPSPQILKKVQEYATDALPKLARKSKEINVEALTPTENSPCGVDPSPQTNAPPTD